jgi:hypothetical protein
MLRLRAVVRQRTRRSLGNSRLRWPAISAARSESRLQPKPGRADIKRRLSQLRKDQQKTGHSQGPDPFHIPKSGVGQVVLVGPPNTGESSLVRATTDAEVKVANYPFTTVIPHPGMWSKDDVQIELVDTPALTPEHVPAGLMGTLRNADIVCVVGEAGDNVLDQIESVLGALSARGLSPRTAPKDAFSVGEPSLRSGFILLNKADLDSAGTVSALRELDAGSLKVLARPAGDDEVRPARGPRPVRGTARAQDRGAGRPGCRRDPRVAGTRLNRNNAVEPRTTRTTRKKGPR